MKNIKTLLIILIAALFFTACEKDEITEQVEHRQIVLLTDYSLGSDVVISIDGRLKSRYPNAEINYVEAAPFDIKAAAYQLEMAAENYPEGTFFLAIVEPGANSERMVFQTEKNQLFVAPDNSLSTRLFHAQNTPDCFRIENSFLCTGLAPDDLDFLDIYTYALFDLIDGRQPDNFGAKIENPAVFSIQDAKFENGILYGQIIYTDNFGNCVSNIPDNLLSNFEEGNLLQVHFGEEVFFAQFGTGYSSVPVGQNVLFANSMKKLELSVNYGDIASRYNMGAGSSIQISQKNVKVGFLQFSNLSESFVEQVQNSIDNSGIDAIYINKNANGDFNVLKNLINELINEGVDIIVPFSTPATQAAVLNTPEEIPLVFTIVTDPESSGIFDKRKNITGLSDAPDYSQFIEFVIQVLPEVNTFGSIYDNQESNSLFSQNLMNQNATLYQLDYVSAGSANKEEIANAYSEIKSAGAKCILISGDNLLTQNCKSLVNLAINDSIPVFGTDVANVSEGALASLSIDYDELCSSTADVVVSVIRGQNPDDLPLQYFNTDVIGLNTTTAKTLGITIPANILENADYIIE